MCLWNHIEGFSSDDRLSVMDVNVKSEINCNDYGSYCTIALYIYLYLVR